MHSQNYQNITILLLPGKAIATSMREKTSRYLFSGDAIRALLVGTGRGWRWEQIKFTDSPCPN